MLERSLTLAETREKAAAVCKLAKAGANPMLERERVPLRRGHDSRA